MSRVLVLFSFLTAACGQLLPVEEGYGSQGVKGYGERDAETDAANASEPAPLHPFTPSPLEAPLDLDAGNAATDAAEAACTPLIHSDGFGHTYKSCAPLGTLSESAAWAACRSFVGDIQITGGSCVLKSSGTCAGKAVCSIGMLSGTNATWDFAGAAPGRAQLYPGAAPLGCPTASGVVWE